MSKSREGKGARFFDHLQYIIMYLIGFAIIGVASLLTREVGWKGFNELSFYIENILTYVAIGSIIIATLLRKIDKFTHEDEEYLAAEKKIQEFAENYIPVIFTRYSDYVNLKRKQKQFVANLRREMHYMLKGKKFLFWTYNKPSKEDLNVWAYGTLAEKRSNDFCKAVALLEIQMTEEWLKDNLDKQDVKYDEITVDVVLGGYYDRHSANSVNDYITKHKNAKLAKDKVPSMLFSFAFSTFTSAVIVTIAFSDSALLNILTKVMVLLWNSVMTVRYANTWNQIVTLKDIRFRRGVVNEYEQWKGQVAKDQAAKDKEHQEHMKAILQKEEPKPEEPKEVVTDGPSKDIVGEPAPVN